MEGSGVTFTSLPRTDVFNPSPTSHWRLVELRCSLLDQSACSSWICRSAQLRYICTYFAPVCTRVVWYLFVPSLWFSVLMNRRSTPTQETFSPHKCCLHHSRWGERRAWCVCVCVCVCVCDITKMVVWRSRGHLMTAYLGRFCVEVACTLSQQCSSPSAVGAAFVVVSHPFPSKPSNFYVPLDSTCQHHPLTTPREVSWAGSWTVPPSWPPVAMVYRAVYLACPDGHFYDQGVQQPPKADTAHSQMGPLMPRVTITYNAHLRQIQPAHRWVHSCREWQQSHTMHTRGRYSPLTDGSTHAKNDNKTIQCTLEADTAHSQMGPLMPRVTTRPYNAHSRQIQPTHRWVDSCQEWQQDHTMHTWGRYSSLTDGSTHAKSDNKTIQCTLKADTAHSQMDPLMPRVTTRPYNAHLRQIQPTHRWIHLCREWQQDHTMHTRGWYSPFTDGSTHAKSTTRPYNAHSKQMAVQNKTHGIHNPLKGGFAKGELCQNTTTKDRHN